jgi:hypothetical protein
MVRRRKSDMADWRTALLRRNKRRKKSNGVEAIVGVLLALFFLGYYRALRIKAASQGCRAQAYASGRARRGT